MTNAQLYNIKYRKPGVSQKECLLDYLDRFGSITPLEALDAFGCMRLSARVWDLRHDGYRVKSRIVDGKNYSIYWLGGEDGSI